MVLRSSRARARTAALACVLAALAVAACGGDDPEATPAISADGPLGEGGTLTWTVAERLAGVDPLAAESRAAQLLTRQIHEPLVAEVAGPFTEGGAAPGLVRGARTSSDGTIWTLKLRRGVRFQDGTPFNAEAVLANAERWRTTPEGQVLLPGLVDAFAPRFDVVKLIIAEPDPDLDDHLASPRLGIVSPKALRPRSGVGAVLEGGIDTGTGPFELRERDPARRLLARNTDWWGTAIRAELGPALDQVELRFERSAAVRLALLDAGDVQLADELGPGQARLADADPLLDALPSAGETSLGVSRSVRGISSGREIPSLAGVWLTEFD